MCGAANSMRRHKRQDSSDEPSRHLNSGVPSLAALIGVQHSAQGCRSAAALVRLGRKGPHLRGGCTRPRRWQVVEAFQGSSFLAEATDRRRRRICPGLCCSAPLQLELCRAASSPGLIRHHRHRAPCGCNRRSGLFPERRRSWTSNAVDARLRSWIRRRLADRSILFRSVARSGAAADE